MIGLIKQDHRSGWAVIFCIWKTAMGTSLLEESIYGGLDGLTGQNYNLLILYNNMYFLYI